MHSDHSAYYRFTGPARLNKAINSILGIIEGVAIDERINQQEITFFDSWLEENHLYHGQHPFNEFIPAVEVILSDGIISKEEHADITWLCNKLSSADYYDQITSDVQRLHAIVAAIASDGVVQVEELQGLSAWLADHDHLRCCWPYDEIDSLITSVLSDGIINEKEHDVLMAFFSEFGTMEDKKAIDMPLVAGNAKLQGLCAVCPGINFDDSLFCFTGASKKYTRDEFNKIVRDLGGRVTNSISSAVDYLVIGAAGNPCWAYACYGRKVEQAVNLRKQGYKLMLVHEYDFHDAIA